MKNARALAIVLALCIILQNGVFASESIGIMIETGDTEQGLDSKDAVNLEEPDESNEEPISEPNEGKDEFITSEKDNGQNGHLALEDEEAEVEEPANDMELDALANVIQIYTAKDLQAISQTGLNKNYILMNDIIVLDKGWKPIGTANAPFTGVFDGNGYKIEMEESVGNAVFGVISSATISSLNFSGSSKTGMIGVAKNSVIEYCVNYADINGNADTGGLVGVAHGGTIRGCENHGTITASGAGSSAGGIVGTVTGNANERMDFLIENSHNMGDIYGEDGVGGLIGRAAHETGSFRAKNCSNTGTVTGQNGVAGLVGDLQMQSMNIIEVKNYGNINGADTVGGIFGSARVDFDPQARGCYNSGNIIGMEYVGGIGGGICITIMSISDVSLSNRNDGTVKGNNYVGGIIGGCIGIIRANFTEDINTGAIYIIAGKTNEIAYAGGIIAMGGVFQRCVNTGTIDAAQSNAVVYIGGIAGKGSATFDCLNTGNILHGTYAGGIFGQGNPMSVINVWHSISSGDIQFAEVAGGIVADPNYIGVHYAVCAANIIDGTRAAGRIVPSMDQTAVSNSVALENTIVRVGGVAQPIAQENPARNSIHGGNVTRQRLKERELYETDIGIFDMDKTWEMRENENHAVLKNAPQREKLLWGDGTPESPYLIYNEQELLLIPLAGLDKHYRVVSDITFPKEAKHWDPIGSMENPFRGSFDGDGYSIHGFQLESGQDYQGLFGVTRNASIKNVHMKDAVIQAGNYIGMIGYDFGSEITACSIKGKIDGKTFVGGIVGYKEGGALSESYVQGRVSGLDTIGGLIGMSEGAHISNSANAATITAETTAGGIVGRFVQECTVSDSTNYGKVTGLVAGGIAGESESGTIVRAMNTGEVSGRQIAGGIVGTTATTSITHSVNAAFKIQTSETGTAGRIAGTTGFAGIENAARKEMQLVVGQTQRVIPDEEDIKSGYQGKGLSSNELRIKKYYQDALGWDFENVWTMSEAYPLPVLRSIPVEILPPLISGGTAADTELDLQVFEGSLYTISVIGTDLETLLDKVFVLEYDADILELTDAAGQVYETILAEGLVRGTDTEILSIEEGVLSFRIHQEIPQGKKQSGALHTVRLRGKADGETTVRIGMQQVSMQQNREIEGE